MKDETARTAKITHSFTNYSPEDDVELPDTERELSVTAREKDKKGLSVSNKVLEFGEHSYRQYSVKLTSKPEAPVEVTVTTNDVDSNVATIDKDGDDLSPLTSTLTLTFTDADWNEAQQVFVRGVDDAVRHPISRSMTITHVGNADYEVDPVLVKVKITDHEDNPRIEILDFPPESIPDASEASPFPSYMVRLSTAPSVAVIVTVEMESDKIGDGLSSTDCGAPLKKIYLAFGDAPTGKVLPEAQPVTICVGDTADNPGSSHDVTIAHTASGGTIAQPASGGEYNDVPAVRKRLKVIDDEDEKEDITRTLRISKKAGFSVQENGGTVEGYGSPVAYTVQLDSRDDRNPTVTLRSAAVYIKVTDNKDMLDDLDDLDGLLSTLDLEFKSDEREFTVYVIGKNDDAVGRRYTNIIHEVMEPDVDHTYNPIEVPITVTDHGDTAGLLITKTITDNELPRPVVNEGATDNYYVYYVRLESSPLPGEMVLVHIISREPSSADVSRRC